MGAEGNKPIIIVQGGQWGSEAKGLITHKLTLEKGVQVAIRTGTVNAGHTVYHNGRAYAMQQLPVSWVKPDCRLVLGPGAYVHPEILDREIGWVAGATGVTREEVLKRIFIDWRCGIHTPDHTERSRESGRHHAMGATGKGCSEAVVDKIQGRGWLNGNYPLFSLYAREDLKARMCDTVELVNTGFDNGLQLLIEGTQGTLLDLHLGSYPYTTHKQTQAASWMAEAGLSCTLPTDLWLVMRSMPIRVAGCSGPMPQEVSWTTLARNINRELGDIGLQHEVGLSNEMMVSESALMLWTDAVLQTIRDYYPDAPMCDPAYWEMDDREAHKEAASEIHAKALNSLHPIVRGQLLALFEVTTVTRKLRRIARWDWEVAVQSLRLNRPHHIALTFMNYIHPTYWGATRMPDGPLPLVDKLNRLAQDMGCGPVGIASFGPSLESTHTLPTSTLPGAK